MKKRSSSLSNRLVLECHDRNFIVFRCAKFYFSLYELNRWWINHYVSILTPTCFSLPFLFSNGWTVNLFGNFVVFFERDSWRWENAEGLSSPHCHHFLASRKMTSISSHIWSLHTSKMLQSVNYIRTLTSLLVSGVVWTTEVKISELLQLGSLLTFSVPISVAIHWLFQLNRQDL